MIRYKSRRESAAQNASVAVRVLGPASIISYLFNIVEEVLNPDIILTLLGSNFISLMARTEVHVVAKIVEAVKQRLQNASLT